MHTNIIKIFEDFNPIIGGTVLILSRKYKDGYKRLFLTRVLQYKKEDSNMFPKISVRVDKENMYLLKEFKDNDNIEIYGDKFNMNGDDLKNIMNMNSDWIIINNNKTPLGSYSIEFKPMDFLIKNQESIKSIKDSYKIKFDDGII